jgi:hypothetical protein
MTEGMEVLKSYYSKMNETPKLLLIQPVTQSMYVRKGLERGGTAQKRNLVKTPDRPAS